MNETFATNVSPKLGELISRAVVSFCDEHGLPKNVMQTSWPVTPLWTLWQIPNAAPPTAILVVRQVGLAVYSDGQLHAWPNAYVFDRSAEEPVFTIHPNDMVNGEGVFDAQLLENLAQGPQNLTALANIRRKLEFAWEAALKLDRFERFSAADASPASQIVEQVTTAWRVKAIAGN